MCVIMRVKMGSSNAEIAETALKRRVWATVVTMQRGIEHNTVQGSIVQYSAVHKSVIGSSGNTRCG